MVLVPMQTHIRTISILNLLLVKQFSCIKSVSLMIIEIEYFSFAQLMRQIKNMFVILVNMLNNKQKKNRNLLLITKGYV